MRTISQADLKNLESDGTLVKRKMGAAPKKEPPPKPVEKRQEPVNMASMAASQNYLEAQADVLRAAMEHNTIVLQHFREELSKQRAPVRGAPASYEFVVKRNRDNLIERVVATPLKTNQ